jgi:hypothetical protein
MNVLLKDFLPPVDIPVWWHASGIMVVVAMTLLYRWARSAPIFVVCIIRLPGVILHELAHLLIGMLLRAQPGSFNLIPQCRGDGRWTLGSVGFGRVTAFNAVPIAFAPLGLVPLALYLYRYWFTWLPVTLANTLLLYTSVFLLICNALPSRQDLRVASNWKSLLLYGSVGGVTAYVLFHCCS